MATTVYYRDARATRVGAIVRLAFVAFLLWMGASLYFQFAAYLDRPEVHFSTETQACVSVVDPVAISEHRPSKWTCEHLPPKYEKVWVY